MSGLLMLAVVVVWLLSRRRRKSKRRPGLYFRRDVATAILRDPAARGRHDDNT
jgi:hypothetical protein